MKRAVLLLLLVTACIPNSFAREIGVCVLVDLNAPVSHSAIDTLIGHASDEYEEHVGISLRELDRRTYRLDVFLSDLEQKEAVERACAGSTAEISIIFSNQMIEAADWFATQQAGSVASRAKGYLLGLGNPAGYVMILSLPHGFRSLDASGNPKVFSTIKHELGHLFFQGHLDDPRSFFYRLGSGYNLWTNETERLILENAETEWSLEFRENATQAVHSSIETRESPNESLR